MPTGDTVTLFWKDGSPRSPFARITQDSGESEWVRTSSTVADRTSLRIASETRPVKGISTNRRLISAATIVNQEGRTDTIRVNVTIEAPTTPATSLREPCEYGADLLRLICDVLSGVPAGSANAPMNGDEAEALENRVRELLLGVI